MDLSRWINPHYLEESTISGLQAKYASAEPFAHLQVTHWLREEKLEELENALQEHEFHHKESDLFGLAQTPDLSESKHPFIQEYVEFLNSDELRKWFNKITKVHTEPGKLDLFGAIYQDTDYLLPHDDQLDDRKIALILYLTTLSEKEGGALALYDEQNGHPKNRVKSYQPERGALNFFTVHEKSWHEVEEITAETFRVSVGGWLRG